ncbi:MAG: lipopolysaccharide biosynthesis protein, partial [Sphingobacteriales bacterium]
MSVQAPNRNLLSSTIWTIVQSFGTQIVTILITAFLSRIVTPEETGCIAMVAFVTSIAQLVIDSGLESSLMRKYENKDADYNSVFIY